MSNNAFLGVAISMVLIFAILASAAAAVTEAVSRFIGLRAEYLLRGLRTLLVTRNTFKLRLLRGRKETGPEPKSNILTAVLSHPEIAANGRRGGPGQAGNGRLSASDRRKMQSYISARAFSRAVVDVAFPDSSGKTAPRGPGAKARAGPPMGPRDQLG